jgi:hypothetical protein
VVGAAGLVDQAAGVVGAAGLVDRWRDLGPKLWLLAAGAGAVRLVLLGVALIATRCRAIDAAPPTVDLAGPGPLAAVDQVGDQSPVRRPARRRTPEAPLTAYESTVLDHVRALAVDSVVPAEALTTGPDGESKGLWRGFRRSWAGQGATVHASVTPRLGQVRDLAVVTPAPAPAVPERDEEMSAPFEALLGSLAAAAARGRRRARTGEEGAENEGAEGEDGAEPGPGVAAPPLPDAATVSEALGRAMERADAAVPHPDALPGSSATFTAAPSTAWATRPSAPRSGEACWCVAAAMPCW